MRFDAKLACPPSTYTKGSQFKKEENFLNQSHARISFIPTAQDKHFFAWQYCL
jgi:Na+-transporting NADH:ubiquinone oxidoreductase subunit NqrA